MYDVPVWNSSYKAWPVCFREDRDIIGSYTDSRVCLVLTIGSGREILPRLSYRMNNQISWATIYCIFSLKSSFPSLLSKAGLILKSNLMVFEIGDKLRRRHSGGERCSGERYGGIRLSVPIEYIYNTELKVTGKNQDIIGNWRMRLHEL